MYENILRYQGIWGLVAALGLAGCAGAQPPVSAADGREDSGGTAASAAESEAQAQPPVVPPYVAPTVPPQARQAVQDAHDAMRKKRWDELARLVPAAAGDPVLGEYPRYWLLSHQLSDRTQPIPDASIRQFLRDNTDAYLSERLRSDWILAASRAEDFKRVLEIRPPLNPSSRVQCARLLARHLSGKPVSADDILKAYLPNSDCWDMLDQMAADQVLSRAQLNDILRNTLEQGQTSYARRVAAIVFDTQGMVQYAALMKNPRRWLKSRAKPEKAQDMELAVIALSRLARSDDRREAAQYIENHWSKWIPPSQLEWVWGQFGLIAALNVEPDAAHWYRQSGTAPKTDYNHAWEVRSELREAPVDWKRVVAAIHKMSGAQAKEPVWRYWQGRALAAQGKTRAARSYYESISKNLDFYGLLANEELGLPPYIPPAPGPLDPAWVAQARARPGLERAVALFELGWRHAAVPEWNFALRGMNDLQLRGAAEFARNKHIYDRVVNTSLLTKNAVDMSQRFIAPFEGQVAAKAQQVNVDPAWVYGLIRQESRFITDVRSSAGASGLMQLMPATAKWVARKIGMKDFDPSRINDFDTNTVLGTNYLHIVLQGLDGSELLATAGYNAGPGRPKRWRARQQARVEGAIFAETIPFTQTRLYVKHVMSNTLYYAMLFSGKPQSLKARLGYVDPRLGKQASR